MYASKAAASAPDEKVVKLTEMGFDKAAVMKALLDTDGNENAALERLLG